MESVPDPSRRRNILKYRTVALGLAVVLVGGTAVAAQIVSPHVEHINSRTPRQK
jgi:hypothetical protein